MQNFPTSATTVDAALFTIDNGRDAIERLNKHSLIYVASPYSSYPHGHDRAYADVAEVCWWLRQSGIRHFSPIVYAHPLARVWGVDQGNGAFWLDFDKTMMTVSDAMVIVDLDGWADSTGIAIETAIFESYHKPVYHLNPETWELTLEGDEDR